MPFISLMFEIQPVKFGRHFSIAASLYLFANFVVSEHSNMVVGGNVQPSCMQYMVMHWVILLSHDVLLQS